MNNLQNEIVFIPASTRGIGYGVACAVLEKGGIVFLGSRNEEKLFAVIDELSNRYPNRVTGARLNLADAASIEEWAAQGIGIHNRLNHLVLNTASIPFGDFNDIGLSAWENALREQVLHNILLLQLLLPHTHAAHNRSVVSLSSISVKQPVPHLLLSNVCRTALHALIKSLAGEMGSEGIRFNTVIMGHIKTERTDNYVAHARQSTGRPEAEILARLVESVPLNRLGSPAEVGAIVTALLQEDASYINGATIEIDGGLNKSY